MQLHRGNLIVLTGSGLGNRLKPILSGMRLAESSHRGFYIHWNQVQSISPLEDRQGRLPAYPSEKKPIPFEGDWAELFGYDLPRSYHRMCVGKEIRSPQGTLPRDSYGTYICRYLFHFLRFDDEPPMDYLIHDKLSSAQKALRAEILTFLPRLEPAPRLRRAVDAFAKANGVDRDTVGIHIRRNHPYTRRVPLESFLAVIERALRGKRNGLLSTDSAEVEDLLRDRFKDRVVFYPKHDRFRGVRSAVEDAIVDLFLLARVGHLVGSPGSSFSDLAWWLGGCIASNEYVHLRSSGR
jgi:hypothetical protein